MHQVGGDAHTIWLRDALVAAGIKAPVLGGVPKVGCAWACERQLQQRREAWAVGLPLPAQHVLPAAAARQLVPATSLDGFLLPAVLQNEGVVIPERHLGLHMPADETVPPNVVEALSELVSTHVDLDALLAMAATAELPQLPAGAAAAPEPAGAAASVQPTARAQQPPVRVAVAHDAAFCFYYHDNLALLREVGLAELAHVLQLLAAEQPTVLPGRCTSAVPRGRASLNQQLFPIPLCCARRAPSSSTSRRLPTRCQRM